MEILAEWLLEIYKVQLDCKGMNVQSIEVRDVDSVVDNLQKLLLLLLLLLLMMTMSVVVVAVVLEVQEVEMMLLLKAYSHWFLI